MQTPEYLGDYLVRTNKISKDDYTCKNKEALKIIQKFRENKRK